MKGTCSFCQQPAVLLEWPEDGESPVSLCENHAELPPVSPRSRLLSAVKGIMLEAVRPEVNAFERRATKALRRATSTLDKVLSVVEDLSAVGSRRR